MPPEKRSDPGIAPYGLYLKKEACILPQVVVFYPSL